MNAPTIRTAGGLLSNNVFDEDGLGANDISVYAWARDLSCPIDVDAKLEDGADISLPMTLAEAEWLQLALAVAICHHKQGVQK